MSIILIIFLSVLSNLSPVNQGEEKLLSNKIDYHITLSDALKGRNPDSALVLLKNAIVLADDLDSGNAREWYKCTLNLEIARVYIDLSNPEAARPYDSVALKLSKANGFDLMEARALNVKGLISYYESDYKTAKHYYREALRLAQDMEAKRLQLKIYSNLGIIHYMYGDSDSAFVHFKATLNLANQINDSLLLAGSLNNLAQVYFYSGITDSAAYYYNKAKRVYEKIGDDLGLLMTINNLGNIYFEDANYSEAIDCYYEAIEINQRLKDRKQLAISYHNIAEVYSHIGAYSEAIRNFLLSIELKESSSDFYGLSISLMGIGTLELNQERPTRALEYYEQAYYIFDTLGVVQQKAKAIACIGMVNSSMGNYERAVEYLQMGIQLSDSIGDNILLSEHYLNLSQVYMQQKKFSKVLLLLDRVEKSEDEAKNPEVLATIYNHKAKIFYSMALQKEQSRLALLDQSISYAQRAMRIGDRLTFLYVINRAAWNLKNAYELKQQFPESLQYFNLYNITKDSLINRAKNEHAIFAEARWQANRKQQVIEELQQNKLLNEAHIQIQKNNNQKQKVFIFGLILLLIFSVGYFLLIIRNRTRKRKLQDEMMLNRLSRLKLQNIKNRLSPHFLFNVLQSVQEDLHERPRVKEKIDVVVSLLRSSLINVEKTTVTIRDEIFFVKRFVNIQKETFIPELDVVYNLDETLLGKVIPAMAIQISVENALKHGLLPKNDTNKKLIVQLEKGVHSTDIRIVDNGVGFGGNNGNKKNNNTKTGLKMLSNTIILLNRKNENKIVYDINRIEEACLNINQGTCVRISIPDEFDFNL